MKLQFKKMEGVNIGIGVYLKEDYQEILNLSEDRDNLDETWEAWKANKKRAVSQLKKQGLTLIDILVKPRDLVMFCRERGLPINGKSRAEYVQHMTQNLRFAEIAS